MNISQFKQIIGEEVRKAIKEELTEILEEAVKIASTPEKEKQKSRGEDVSKIVERRIAPKEYVKNPNPILAALEETQASMTSEDYEYLKTDDPVSTVNKEKSSISERTVFPKIEVPPENQVGLDISSLPFVRSAKKILDESERKDKEKYGNA